MQTKATSLDVRAQANSAYTGMLLRLFVRGYQAEANDGCPFPLIFVVLPATASSGRQRFFDGCNKATRLPVWAARSPELLATLSSDVIAALPLSRAALRFSIVTGLLVVRDARIFPGNTLPKNLMRKHGAPTVVGKALRRAERLGHWCGRVRQTETVLATMGLS